MSARLHRPLLGRGLSGLLAVLMIGLGLTAIVIAEPARAAITSPFTQEFSVNARGDVVIRGNTLMSCVTGAGGCTNARNGVSAGDANNNNGHTMAFVDTDADGATFNSSSATVTVPQGGSVLFAALVWGGDTATVGVTNPAPNAANRNQAKIKAPGGSSYTTLTADQLNSTSYGDKRPYQGWEDVTSLIRAGGSGAYTVADVQSSRGTDVYAGWALVVAMADPAAPSRNMTIYRGFGTINASAGNTSASIPVSNFLTPPLGAVRTTLGAVTYEGDRGSTGDKLTLNGTELTDALNLSGNSFNSTLSDRGVATTGRSPAYSNQLGFDADLISADNVLANGATSATIGVTTGGETFYPGVLTFATELYEPKLVGTKTVNDVNGGSVEPGDVLRYSVPVKNLGIDDADATRFFDAIPTGTTYDPGSLEINGNAVTDAVDGDFGSFRTAGGLHHVEAYLGTGATSTAGGRINTGGNQIETVAFGVVVDAGVIDGQELVNVGAMGYVGRTTQAADSSATNTVVSTVVAPDEPDPGNTPPVATPDVDTFAPSTGTPSLLVDVTDNDADADSDPLTVVDVTAPSGGTAVAEAGGVRYTPRADFAGRDVFTYTISDGGNGFDTETVSIDVTTNRPVADDDAASTPANHIKVVDVLDGDTDPDGDALSIRSVDTTGTTGSVTILGNNTVRYTPANNATGVDTFTYVVEDSRGRTDEATVIVTVTPNAAPVGVADSYSGQIGAPINVNVLGNDTDANGDTLTATKVADPAHGTVSLNADGTGTYTPTGGYSGPDSFTYRALDGYGGQSSVTTVTIGINGAPVADDETATVATNTPGTVAVLPGDTDPNGDTLTVTSATDGAHGTTVVNGNDTVTYTPDSGYAGADSFTYVVSDGAVTDTGTVTVTVSNAAPTVNGPASGSAGPGVTDDYVVLSVVDDANVTGEAWDQTLTVTGASANNGATATVNLDGTVRVAPAPGFKGAITVSFTVSDGAGGSVGGTLTVTIANAGPVATDDTGSTGGATSVLVDVLDNDDDDNGDTLSIAGGSVTVPRDAGAVQRGTAVIESGKVRWTPPAGWLGTVTFDYNVTDGTASDTGRVTATATNTAPVTVADTANANSGETVNIDVVGNDVDPNVAGAGQTLAVSGVSANAGATVSVNGNGTVRVEPAAGFKGAITVSFTVSDGIASAAGSLVVTVANAPPVAVDDSGSTTAGATSVMIDVLANDTDANGDARSIAGGSVTLPRDAGAVQRGSVAIESGKLRWTPPTGYIGTVTFDYNVTDGTDSDTGRVTATAVNTPPTANADTATADTDETIDVDVLANDVDPNVAGAGQTLSVSAVSANAGATVSINSNGTVRVEPAVGFKGAITVSFTVSDGVASVAGSLVVTVANAGPHADDDSGSTVPGATSVLINVLANDDDDNGDALSIAGGSVTLPRDTGAVQRGSVAIEGGKLRWTPPAGWIGTVTFDYDVTDGTSADTGRVTATAVNTPPTVLDDAETADSGETIDVDVLGNDTDPNVAGAGQTLAVTSVSADSGATASVTSDGEVRVVPAAGFKGTILVSFTVSDGVASVASSLVVAVANGAPVADDDAGSTTVGATSVLIDVLDNDDDVNGDALSIAGGSVTLPRDAGAVQRGTVAVDSGKLRWTPPTAWVGTVTFDYDVTDGATADTGTVTATAVNTPPTAVDDAAGTHSGDTVDLDVRANDTDPNVAGASQALRVSSVDSVTGAAVTVLPSGLVRVAAGGSTVGLLTIGYTVTDDAGGFDTGVLRVTVNNAAPVAANDAFTTAYMQPVDIDAVFNDTDTDGDPLTVQPGSLGVPRDSGGNAHGSVTLVNGKVRYAPPVEFSGVVRFGYRATDGVDSALAQVKVTVEPAPPVAVADQRSVPVSSGPILIDVLGNDSDGDGGGLTLLSVSRSAHGGRTSIVNGQIRYVPAPGFVGVDTFSYLVLDEEGETVRGSVRIAVGDLTVKPDGSGDPDHSGGAQPQPSEGTHLPRTGVPLGPLSVGGLAALVVGLALLRHQRHRKA